MPIWQIAPVTDKPEVSIYHWRILETDKGTRHFVGADEHDGSGRVSTAIVAFDRSARHGKTRSGRVYHLIGEPGYSDNGEYVWTQWCKVNDVASCVDVTRQALAEEADDNPA
ncbi:hypothetical protein CY652_18080 [Burkholderia sp. WAC0059]|uniref:hypothetical protein n=1 Tax=Burkholderia sp. WAC0059 TaxID=2066022 RepID=UPI000C7F5866|nr:hypothetical protein [Burkholderia sp. WAC0059]PLZ01038.1 hypothetical protein CY652_18080 [Burkholderia sp. WAC0059]